MKKYSLLAGLALLSVGSFTSCTKDKDPAPATKTELLTAKNWRVTAFTVKPSDGPLEDIYKGTRDCEKDDFYQFKADKTLVLDEGKTRCDANDPQTTVSGWNITADGNIILLLEMKGASSAELYEVKELTSDKLHLVQTYSEKGVSIVGDVTFTAF